MSRTVTYIKTSSLNKKLSQLVVAIALLIICLNVWLNVTLNGQQLIKENVTILSQNILQQTAHSARQYIIEEDIAGLNLLTESALESDYIHEMLIYDDKGIVLSQSAEALSAKQRFLDNTDDPVAPMEPTPFVTEIVDINGQLLGFIRLTVLKQNLQQDGISFLQSIMKQIMLVALLAGFIGYLLTNGLKPFSKNAYIIKD